jgi:hypothetical protein
MSRYRYLVLALLAASIIMNVVLLMFLVGGRQAATVEQVPAGKNSAVETYKITEDTVMSGGSLPQYQSVEELPASLRQRIEVLHAAKGRRFTPLDGIIERFSIREETVPQAVAKLCNDHTVICGLEVVPWPSTSQDPVLRNLKRFSVSFEKASPRQILDSLVSKDPAFLWVEERGIANVVPTKAYNSPAYPLNKKIPQFEVEDRPYTMVFAGVVYPAPALFGLPEVQEALPIGGSGRWPREFEPQVSVHAQDKTVREIINEVARQVGMAWSLASCVQRNGEDLAAFRMHPHVSLPDCLIGKPDVNLPAPAISFENEVYNFGELDVNETAQCEFTFRNIGDGILRIERISETCGCTAASISRREYEPGEQGLIQVTYRAQRQPGFVSQDLSVYTNDPANPGVRLLIQGEVVDVTQ